MTDPSTKALWGIAEAARYFGVSRILASKWAREKADFPSPLEHLDMGRVWSADAVKGWGRRNGRKKGAGPRAAGDPRRPG